MGKRWLHWGAGGGGGGGGGGDGDPLFASVVWLLPLDGADGDKNVAPFNTDFSPLALETVVRSGAVADNTTFGPKFGTTSADGFDSNLDTIHTSSGGDTSFDMKGGPFVMEMWGAWLNDTDRDANNNVIWRRRPLIARQDASPPRWSFAYKPYDLGPNMIFEWRTDDAEQHSLEGGGQQPSGVWQHYCVERGADDILRIMVNGVVVASTNISGDIFTDGGPIVSLGAQDNTFATWNGHIDDVRVTIGVARYNGGFDVPTEANPLSA